MLNDSAGRDEQQSSQTQEDSLQGDLANDSFDAFEAKAEDAFWNSMAKHAPSMSDEEIDPNSYVPYVPSAEDFDDDYGNPDNAIYDFEDDPASEFELRPVGRRARSSASSIDTKIIIVVIIVCIVIGAGLAAFTFFKGSDDTEASQAVRIAAMKSKGADITMKADGWNSATSTMAIIHVTGTVSSEAYIPADADEAMVGATPGAAYEAYFAVNPTVKAHLDLPEGTYVLEFISPINADGSVYLAPSTVEIEVGRDSTASASYTFDLVSGDNLTAEMSRAVLEQVSAAVTKAAPLKNSASFTAQSAVMIELAAANVKVIEDAEAEAEAEEEEEAASAMNAASTYSSTNNYYSYSDATNTTGGNSDSGSGDSGSGSGGDSGSGGSGSGGDSGSGGSGSGADSGSGGSGSGADANAGASS